MRSPRFFGALNECKNAYKLTCMLNVYGLRRFSCAVSTTLDTELKRLCDAGSGSAGSDNEIELPIIQMSTKLVKIRHTAAHVLAMAVQRLYPSAQVATGPWTDTG